MKKDNKTKISGSWTTVPRQGQFLTKRWGHTAITYKNFIYIFGGTDYRDEKCRFYQFDCDTGEIIAFNFSDFTDGRESHSCCIIDDNLFVYGGCHGQTFVNSLLNISLKNFLPQVIEQKPPFPFRQSHVAAMLNNKFMFVYGGSDEYDQYRDEFWLLQLENLKWFEIKKTIGVILPKVGCSIVRIKDFFYIYGGEQKEDCYNAEVYKITFSNVDLTNFQDLEQVKVQEMKVRGIKPQARSCHSCVVYKSEYMVLFGGQASKKFFNDVWLFDPRAPLWTEVIFPCDSNIKGRSNSAAAIYKDKIYIFGGSIQPKKNVKVLDELLILEINEFAPETIFDTSSSNSITLSLDYPLSHLNGLTISNNPQMCSICLLQYCPTTIQSHTPLQSTWNYSFFQVSFSTIAKTAAQIINPFDAFGLLFACASQFKSHLHIVMKQIHSHYQQVLYPLSNQNQISQIQIPGHYLRKATPNTSFILEFYFPTLKLEEHDFKTVVYNYKYSKFSSKTDVSMIKSLVEKLSQNDLECLGFSLKNGLLRLGSQVLLLYYTQKQIYSALISSFGISYSLLLPTNTDIPSLIIKKYINDYSIRPYGLGLYVHVSSLKNISDCFQLYPTGFDILCKFNKDASLRNYLSKYFLNPTSSVYIQKQIVKYFSQEQPSHMQVDHEYLKTNTLLLHQHCQNVLQPILVYHNNRYIGAVRRYKNIKGYVQLHQDSELNLTFTKIQDSGRLLKAMDELVNNFLSLTCKRLTPVETKKIQTEQRKNNGNIDEQII